MRVVCLEQGDWTNPSDYPTNAANWESLAQGPYHIDPNVRGLASDYPINNDDSECSVVNFNGVGGSTILYGAHFPRLHPSDFKVKSLDGVADDWPIDYDTLEPFFAENDRVMGVSGLAGDPMYPPKAPPLPPIAIGRVGETIARGASTHWVGTGGPRTARSFRQPYEDRDRCLFLGPCLSGCAQGGKSTTDITYWPRAIRGGVELRTRCRVRELALDDRGRRERRRLLRRERRRAVPTRGDRDHGVQRRRHAAHSPQLDVRALSRRPGQRQRPGRQEPHVPRVRHRAGALRGAA